MPKVKIPRQWKFGSVPEEILESNLSVYAKIAIAAITFHAFDDGPSWPGTERLARLCSCSKRVIFRSITELEKAGFLKVSREKGKVNEYQFLSKTSYPQSLVEKEKSNNVPHSHAIKSEPVTLGQCLNGQPVTHGNTNDTFKTNETKTSVADATPAQSEAKIFIEWWTTQFQVEFGTKYFFQGGKDGLAVKRLLSQIGLEQLKDLVLVGWRTPDKKGFSTRTVCKTISGFSTMVNQLTAPAKVAGKIPYHYDASMGESWFVNGKWVKEKPIGA